MDGNVILPLKVITDMQKKQQDLALKLVAAKVTNSVLSDMVTQHINKENRIEKLISSYYYHTTARRCGRSFEMFVMELERILEE